MFRYKLRTLLIVLALGPPILAWMFTNPNQIRRAVFVLLLYYVVAAKIYQIYGPKPNREAPNSKSTT